MPAYYASSLGDFLSISIDAILRDLVAANAREFSSIESAQVEAWEEEVLILRRGLSAVRDIIPSAVTWGVLLEFRIPRRGRRIDAVVLARDVICVLEFKGGITDQGRLAVRQVEDYALELADFHQPSHDRTIVPLVVARGTTDPQGVRTANWVQAVRQTAPDELGKVMVSSFQLCSAAASRPIDCLEWNNGVYRPVPTIIEAATALYAGASVREITHSHSGLQNLTKTTDFVLEAVQRAQSGKLKVLCFITGIPGAGKTLVGLNLVHNRQIQNEGRPASVFMSGNGPLVKILREALACDHAGRTNKSVKNARREVRTFIQNIHQFVQDSLERDDSQLPYEHVIVFDEAQRAWNANRNKRKYRNKSSQWHVSEPAMVLSIMDRHPDWAVVVALVGGGQEINDGEAGLAEWGRALENGFKHWHVLASPEALDGGDSVAGGVLFSGQPTELEVTRESVLHLQTCVRSHRAEALASWVNCVLSGDSLKATRITKTFDGFPIMITRDLDRAKDWLRDNTRGTRRCGLVASSGAARLRAYGIETSQAFRQAYLYPRWFLAPQADVRSSYQLEIVATEFEIQGLELDNVALCWGGDLTWSRDSQSWIVADFRGTRWVKGRDAERNSRTINRYRVLLTRARQGLVIWVPRGDASDPTRSVSAMDDTVDYLVDCGGMLLA